MLILVCSTSRLWTLRYIHLKYEDGCRHLGSGPLDSIKPRRDSQGGIFGERSWHHHVGFKVCVCVCVRVWSVSHSASSWHLSKIAQNRSALTPPRRSRSMIKSKAFQGPPGSPDNFMHLSKAPKIPRRLRHPRQLKHPRHTRRLRHPRLVPIHVTIRPTPPLHLMASRSPGLLGGLQFVTRSLHSWPRTAHPASCPSTHERKA